MHRGDPDHAVLHPFLGFDKRYTRMLPDLARSGQIRLFSKSGPKFPKNRKSIVKKVRNIPVHFPPKKVRYPPPLGIVCRRTKCSSMFVVGGKKIFVRRCSSLFVVGCPCGRDLFVDVRRCSSTNIDEQNRRTFYSSTNQKCSSAHYA